MDMRILKEKMYGLNEQIATILRECGYAKTDSLQVDLKEEVPEDSMLYDEFVLLMKHLVYRSLINWTIFLPKILINTAFFKCS